jgi:hypothetical protein
VTNYRAGRGVFADANLVYFILIFFNVTTTSLIGILWSGESVEQSKPSSNIGGQNVNPE